jgi:hypothetical protein
VKIGFRWKFVHVRAVWRHAVATELAHGNGDLPAVARRAVTVVVDVREVVVVEARLHLVERRLQRDRVPQRQLLHHGRHGRPRRRVGPAVGEAAALDQVDAVRPARVLHVPADVASLVRQLVRLDAHLLQERGIQHAHADDGHEEDTDGHGGRHPRTLQRAVDEGAGSDEREDRQHQVRRQPRVHVRVADGAAEPVPVQQQLVPGEQVAEPEDDEHARDHDGEVQARPVVQLQPGAAHAHGADQRVADADQQHRPDHDDEEVLEHTRVERQAEDVEGDVMAEQRVGHAPALPLQPRQHGHGHVAAELQRGQPPACQHRHQHGAADQVAAGHLLRDLEVAVPAAQVHGPELPQDEPQVDQDQGGTNGPHHEVHHRRREQPLPEDAALADGVVPEHVRVEDGRRPPEDEQQQDDGYRDHEVTAGVASHGQTTIPWARSQPRMTPSISSSFSCVRASKRMTSTGCVFDARSSPQPPSNRTRTPSTSMTS